MRAVGDDPVAVEPLFPPSSLPSAASNHAKSFLGPAAARSARESVTAWHGGPARKPVSMAMPAKTLARVRMRSAEGGSFGRRVGFDDDDEQGRDSRG